MFTVILLLVSNLLFSYKWGKIEKSHSNPCVFSIFLCQKSCFIYSVLIFIMVIKLWKHFLFPYFANHAINSKTFIKNGNIIH